MTEVNKQEPLIRQARRKLAELFPDDYSVYEKWEQYKEIYASAYRSAPNNMDKIIEYWIDTISPYDHGVHHSELVFPLNVLNNTIATGYGKQHLYDIVRIIAPPQSYAIIYLLWQCNSISNDERLKRAKKDFLERGYTDEDADIIRDYDINLETLQEWRHDEPERPLSHRMFGANPTINAGASQYLKKNFPDKADSYETISKGINLYVQAYHDAFHSFSLSHSIVASILFFNLSEMSSSRSQIIVFFCAISKCNFVLFLQSWITVLPSPIAYPSSKYAPLFW